MEIFCKDWNYLSEAVRHFRALDRQEGLPCRQLDVDTPRYHVLALFIRALNRAGTPQ